jgi:uncharacterized integral membrane protein
MTTPMANGQEAAVSTVSVETTAEMLNGGGTAARRTSETVQTQTMKPLETDPWIYRIVVIVLGLVMLTGAGGSIALALVPTAKDVPTILIALGSAAVGALAGLLAPSPNATR